jgi:hypothetical protein
MVEGELLNDAQASNAFDVIDRTDPPGYDIYTELGIPAEFKYGDLSPGLGPLDCDSTNFGYRLWFDLKSISHYSGKQSRHLSNGTL